MSAFNPAGLVIEYGQLDTLLTDGQTPGSHADDLFLNMLDQYDQATGSDGYFDHDGMVDELLDALNRRLNPIGLEASRSGVVYCNVMNAPDLHEVVGAVEAFMEQDWDRITQNHDASNRPELRDLWYDYAPLEGIDQNGVRHIISHDQVTLDETGGFTVHDDDGNAVTYDWYRFTVDVSDDFKNPEHVHYDFTPEEMAAFVTGEFVNPDHAAREVAARSVHQHSVDVEVSAFVTGEYAYRLSYDEVTNGLSEEENPYTGLPEALPTGEGFHTTVRLERYDPEAGDWDEIDSESVDGPDAEASAPYDDAERRIIARNGLEDRRIEVVAPWGSHTIEPEPSPAVSEKSVSLNAEAKTMRDASQALDGHDAAANERPLDR